MKKLFLLGIVAAMVWSCNPQTSVEVAPVSGDSAMVDSMLVEQPLDSLADSIVVDTVVVSK